MESAIFFVASAVIISSAIGFIFYMVIRKGSKEAIGALQSNTSRLEREVTKLNQEIKHLNKRMNSIEKEKQELADAMSEWDIYSYKKMTDMIFSSYMATKSPEISGKGIIAAIEKRCVK